MIILGSGPNRIGQGIEFDYSCVHAVARAERGRLRDDHGQLQPRDRLDRLRHLRPALLRAADARGRARGRPRRAAGRPDRRRHLPARRPDPARAGAGAGRRRRPDRRHDARGDPPGRGARRLRPGAGRGRAARRPSTAWRRRSSEAQAIAHEIGYPVLVRPSYVLGGRGMEIVYDDDALEAYIARATAISPEQPVLVDRFIDDAVEIDVDALYDGEELYLGGVMEHIEEAGIHSGDSSCALPPITLGATEIRRIREATEAIARGRRRARPDQHPVRARLRRALRARGQPARVADRAVRLEGDRRAAGQGRGAGDARRVDRLAAQRGRARRRGRRGRPAAGRPDRDQGGGDALQPLQDPRRADRRHRARARDALDRRGDGLRRGSSAAPSPSRRRRRTDRCRRRAGCSRAWPTATSGP